MLVVFGAVIREVVECCCRRWLFTYRCLVVYNTAECVELTCRSFPPARHLVPLHWLVQLTAYATQRTSQVVEVPAGPSEG